MTISTPVVNRTVPFRIRQIAIPTEHGGWSFLFEPIVGGLLIAFSAGGLWISLSILGAFLCRQPLKVLIADRIGMRVRERAKAAIFFLFIYASVATIGVLGTVISSGREPLWPFAFVLPLIGFQIFNDVSRRGRQLLPEVSSAISISSSAAAITLADGQLWLLAVSLWIVFVARSIPSILYVRNRLLLEKGKPYSRTGSTVAHIVAVAVVGVLTYSGLSSILALVAMIVLLWRSVAGLSGGKKLKAIQIGIREVVYGTLTVLLVTVGYHLGF